MANTSNGSRPKRFFDLALKRLVVFIFTIRFNLHGFVEHGSVFGCLVFIAKFQMTECKERGVRLVWHRFILSGHVHRHRFVKTLERIIESRKSVVNEA